MSARLALCLDNMLKEEALDSQRRNDIALDFIKESTNPESIRIFKKSIMYREKRFALLQRLVEARKANDYDEVEKKTQEMKTLYFTTFPS
jgi:hypothetical protein